jgi:hypothetical protein
MSIDQTSIQKPTPSLYVYPESIQQTVTLEKQIRVQLYLSALDSSEPINITLPEGIKMEQSLTMSVAQVITLSISLDQVSVDHPLESQVIIRAGAIEKIVSLNIQRSKVEIEGYNQSCYIKLSEAYYLSRSPLIIHNELAAIGEDALRDVYGFTIQKSSDGILLSYSDMSFSLTNGSRKAFILTKSGKVEIDLLMKVELSNHQFLVPIDTIFQMLNLPIRIDQERFYSSIV